ncbi:riboflavin kinase-like isoform X3 [Limulus polyphemus]|uniref:riboflavin kinase n=1 Tax=Limulus polyphemus TaxID=6850 RepID=A0ABM1BCX7_LIMPO|nr:riboflavin kinase-like isoform X3 [Limulus polyphemus]
MNCVFRNALPFVTMGRVVKGFGRGSKELGIPTANFSEDVVEHLPKELDCGIYCGWAKVDSGPVYKMVMSIGWNPYYKNTKKSIETHILHEFKKDFYGSMLKVAILAYLRPEKNFSSLEELITAIKSDIQAADKLLEQPEYQIFKDNSFFQDKNGQNNKYINGHKT